MKKKYFLSIDQGTTGTTALLIDSQTLKIKSFYTHDFSQYFPENSWVEHDLNDIYKSVEISILNVLKQSKISSSQITAIGITNQRETSCAFDKKGKPLHRAIVWQDRRTHDFCQKNKARFEKNDFKKKTGLPLDPYFSATKFKWLLENSPKVKKAYEKKNLLFSTIDSFLLYKLTNGDSFKTDVTNASRTLLMELRSLSWDNKLLKFFSLDRNLLPEICENTHHFGTTKNCSFLPDGIPITCMIGDQQSALLGQFAINKGDTKCTYGTGAFILSNTGSDIIYSDKGLLTTPAFKIGGITHYALEGSTYIAGAAISFLKNNLGLFQNVSEIEKLIKNIKDEEMSDLFFFPFLTGIGTPHWNSEIKGSITGLTRATTKNHLIKACLEGIALSVNDTIDVFKKDSSHKIKKLFVDGGASQNNSLMQMQANFSEIEIIRSNIVEATSFGAALGCKIFQEQLKLNELKNLHSQNRSFKKEKSKYAKDKKNQWKKLILKQLT